MVTETLTETQFSHGTRLEPDPLGPDVWTLNFGPQHPATHTTLRIVLELDGERIIRATPHIGYLHSGFEKLGEHLDYDQYVVVTDRMNYCSPLLNNIAWHHAAEKLFGIEITPRCKVLRTIVAELARIYDHLVSIGCTGLDLGAYTAFMYAFNEREGLGDIFELASGARFTTSWTRVGGLNMDIPEQWPAAVKKFCGTLPKVIDDIETLLNKNRIFIERTKGIGVLSHEDAIEWSVTGPVARGSGVRRDLRKDEPYLAYDQVDFQIPIATGGDVYSRYLVRLREMEQSLSIIAQLIDDIPDGPIDVDAESRVHLPSKAPGDGAGVYGGIEGLISHFERVMTNRGFTPPVGESYGAIEAANGELGFYLASDGGRTPYRARCRPPCFINYQTFPSLIQGHQISEIPPVLNSLNVIAAELDR